MAESAYSLDKWHGNLVMLRQFLKGWGANIRGDYRREKEALLQQLREIDEKVNVGDTDPILMRSRYKEEELEKLMEAEELYWQRRGDEKWVLEGDLNTAFFHLVANGRKRKKHIFSLVENNQTFSDPEKIQQMIYD